MKKLLFILIITLFSLFMNISITQARITGTCQQDSECTPDGVCIPDPNDPTPGLPKVCRPPSTSSVFGKIVAPSPLAGIVAMDQTGAKGLSQFFSNLIALFYSVAALVLILMMVWGAFDWITSEGDKEKVESARKKLINAIIGIILFAIAFAVIQILGHFTGFTFFVGQIP